MVIYKIWSPLFLVGLFHGSILQSGNELSPWTMVFPDMEPEKFLQEVAGKLGCPESPSDAMADCLRTIDATELMNTTFQCTVWCISPMYLSTLLKLLFLNFVWKCGSFHRVHINYGQADKF